MKDPPGTGDPLSSRRGLAQRLSLREDQGPSIVIALVVALGALLLLWLFGEGQWFTRDDWRLIGVDGLLQDHNQHWSTLTILAYRALYLAFGLNSYVPYQIVGVLVHLLVVVLLYLVMRRACVRSWVAVVVAGSLVLFTPGVPLVLSQFQMTLGLSLGLVQLLLADHDGVDRFRDGVAVLAGLLAIMTSGVGVAVVVGVGLAVLLRRGWAAAAFQTVPLAVLYLVWWVLAAPTNFLAPASVLAVADWLVASLDGVILGIGGSSTVLGASVMIFTVAGASLILLRQSVAVLRSRYAAVAGLLGAGLFLSLSTYFGRGVFGSEEARSGRFAYLLVACVLPFVAVAIDELIRFRKWLAIPTLGLLLLVVALNFTQLSEGVATRQVRADVDRQQLAAISEYLHDPRIPDDLRPWIGSIGVGMGDVEMRFLRSARNSGRLDPMEIEISQQIEDEASLRMGLAQMWSVPKSDPSECRTYEEPIIVRPEVGEVFLFADSPFAGPGPIRITERDSNATSVMTSGDGPYLEAFLPDKTIEIAPASAGRPFYLCQQ